MLTTHGEVVIDGDFSDWDTIGQESSGAVTLTVTDPADMGDSSGDLAEITATVEGENLILTMAAHGVILPTVEETPEGKTNRYYYHWLIDTDNNPATGVSNATYENNPTGVERDIGTEIVVQFGWRNGAPDGIYAYSPLDPDETPLTSDYPWERTDNAVRAMIPLAELGLIAGQTVSISAFQEGASDSWATDFMESGEFKIPAGGGGVATPVSVTDPADMGDSSGDLAEITATVEGENLILTMASHGVILPTVEETPEGKTNRYYYHWLIDSDNNPSTGVSNATYENNPTGVEREIGTEIVIQFGWRNGAPDGIYAYSPLDPDETPLISDYTWEKTDNVLRAELPYEALGLIAGQTISVSAFQEGASDSWATDFIESVELKIPASSGGNTNILVVDDPVDDMLDPSGDIKQIRATTDGEFLYLGMTVESVIAPGAGEVGEGLTNRYYYHWLIDADNNAATGVSNATYENNPTGVTRVIGTEIVVQFGWRDGAPDGVYAYDPTDPDEGGLVSEYEWATMGDSVEAKLPLEGLGLSVGQRVSISAFQEGASDGWATDWMESDELLLRQPDSAGGAIDCAKQVFVDAYGFTVVLEDCEGIEIDPDSISATLDGNNVSVTTTREGNQTTVTAQFEQWLQPGAEHGLTLEYPGGATAVPVVVPEHTVIPPTYGVKSLEGVPRGFAVNVSQVSDFQAQESGTSAHNYDLEKAELQLAGELTSPDGKPYYNEASDSETGWKRASTAVEGIINWSEDAPTEAGYFHTSATGQTDEPIPLVPGSKGSSNGLVIELLAYLELEPGYHRLGLNTIGGFKASMGPDGRDRLSPVLGSYENAVNYSFLGDKYFDVLVAEAGYYPLRVLFTHVERTKEGASMELFSLKGTRRIAINDPDDPDAIKAYQFISGDATYVSAVSPTPGTDYAKANASIDLVIEQGGAQVVPGSIRMTFDGVAVNPQVSTEGSELRVRYFPGSMDFGSSHEVEFAYTLDTDPPLEREDIFDFGVYRKAAVLSPAWGSPVDSGSEPGFWARVVQDPGPRGNSAAEAEKQLAGEGTFSATASLPVINLGGGGLFQEDMDFTGAGLLEGDNIEYFSMEVLTHLHLEPGAYTFGVNSDDGFVVSVGKEATEKTIVLSGWDSGRGIASDKPQNLYDVVVREEGLYAFRLVFFQGVGGAAVEWYQYDRDTETATLLNTEGAPAAYQTRTTAPAAFPEARISAPERADFGSISVNAANLPSGFIVHNTGGQPLEITRAEISGADSENFTLTDYPNSIAAGDAGLFKVTFDAKGVPGGYTAAVELDTNDAAQPAVMVELSAGALDPIGPIAHFAMDETEGVTLRDRSGNQRDGTFTEGEGGISLGQPALATGTSVAFQGGAFASVSGAHFGRWEDFTLSAWIQAEAVGEAPQMVFGKGDPVSGNPNFALLFSSAGLLWFAGSEAEPGFASEPGVIQAGQKHHVVVSFKTTGAERVGRVYVDGAVVAEKADQSFIATGVNEPLFFGSFQGAVALDGRLDGIQLYDRPLSGEEIAFLYENPDEPLSTELPSGPTDGMIPVLSSVQWSDNGFETAFATEVGVAYELQYSVSLEPGSWIAVGTLTGDGTVQSFNDADAGRQALPAGFYRVLLE